MAETAGDDGYNKERDVPLCRDAMSLFVEEYGGNVKNEYKMNSKTCNKMIKNCFIRKEKHLTTADVDIIWTKCKVKDQKYIDLNDDNAVDKFIRLLAKELQSICKLEEAGCQYKVVLKIISGATKLKKIKTLAPGTVAIMADTNNKYTGSLKERFDNSGKEEAIAGRKDAVEKKGFVGTYKDEKPSKEK